MFTHIALNALPIAVENATTSAVRQIRFLASTIWLTKQDAGCGSDIAIHKDMAGLRSDEKLRARTLSVMRLRKVAFLPVCKSTICVEIGRVSIQITWRQLRLRKIRGAAIAGSATKRDLFAEVAP